MHPLKRGVVCMKTSVVSNGLLWFGAGISIAEILTGMLVAPLGFVEGATAILIGHLIGGAVMFAAGLIGARTGVGAMETVGMAFGSKGRLWFALLNVIQLIGWTAVMIATAATSADALVPWGNAVWSVIAGAGIALWILLGIKNLDKVNRVIMAALLLLTLFLSRLVFDGIPQPVSGDITFGGAVELAVAMPLSWLPLIADYTRTAESPVKVTVSSCLSYFVASCWMFFIGMGAVIYLGSDDLAAVMAAAGLGGMGILIVLLSTITTTFLDALSAGISASSISPRLKDTSCALVTCVLGVILAVFFDTDAFQDFLYFIGSVFAPMTAILIADYFVLHADRRDTSVNLTNLVLWAMGFCLYRQLLDWDTPLGITFPVIVAIVLLSVLVHKVTDKRQAA